MVKVVLKEVLAMFSRIRTLSTSGPRRLMVYTTYTFDDPTTTNTFRRGDHSWNRYTIPYAPCKDTLDLTVEDAISDRIEEDIKSLDANIRALQRQRAALEAKSSAASASASTVVHGHGALPPPAKKIKRENHFTSGEAIDLT
ncbi:hypothetical protein J3A83DRAFT_4187343 [Scleroderma citrinum]